MGDGWFLESPTARELEVLEHIVNGLNNSEIAASLYITVNTVKHHVKELRRKLCARSRAHLITRSLLCGLLSVDYPSGGGDLLRCGLGSTGDMVILYMRGGSHEIEIR